MQLRIELRPLHDIAPAASSANRSHIELKERTTSGAASQLFPPIKRLVRQGIRSVFFITEVIQYNRPPWQRRQFELPALDTGFYRPKNT